jgi:carbon-monoxide dehydrogenase small subunit
MLERRWTINGEEQRVRFEPLARLLDVLRDDLELISLKEGCGEGECGACSLIIDGELQLGCLIAAAQLEDGAELLTAEGLGASALGQSLMKSYDVAGAVQCGYCSPGMLLGSYALLKQTAAPTEEQIRAGLAGHLCRCTGYSTIVEAVQRAAEDGQAAPPESGPGTARARRGPDGTEARS